MKWLMILLFFVMSCSPSENQIRERSNFIYTQTERCENITTSLGLKKFKYYHFIDQYEDKWICEIERPNTVFPFVLNDEEIRTISKYLSMKKRAFEKDNF